MLLGVVFLPTGKRRTCLTTQIDALFAEDFAHHCLPFDSRAAAHDAKIVSVRHKSGKPVSTEDAQIAAIARSRNFQIATRNVADFTDIEELEIVNPWVASDWPSVQCGDRDTGFFLRRPPYLPSSAWWTLLWMACSYRSLAKERRLELIANDEKATRPPGHIPNAGAARGPKMSENGRE